MASMFGKTALLALLKQEGALVMFGNPGTTELPVSGWRSTATGG